MADAPRYPPFVFLPFPADKPGRTMPNDLHPELSQPYASQVLLGDSPATQRLRLQVARIAPHFRVALLVGEEGTGKEAVAREMHRLGATRGGEFQKIQPDTVASASAGILYLPGIDACDAAAQLKLQRALRTLPRDTRLIFPSRTDLKGMVATGRMPATLYDRVGNLEIRLAPLRNRLDDLGVIAASMLRTISQTASLEEDTVDQLKEHLWPGNFAELHSLLQRLAPLGAIESAHLPEWRTHAEPTAERLEEVMYRHVMDVLQGCAGNKLRAAELLGISRSTLYRMLEARQLATLG